VRSLLFMLIVFLGGLMLTSCQLMNEKSLRASRDWSRGQRVGQAALNSEVGLAVSPSGEDIYVTWIAQEEDRSLLRYARLDASSRVLLSRDLRISTNVPSSINLLLDEDRRLHMTWLDRLADDYRLFYVALDTSGELVTYPGPLSPDGLGVSEYAVGLKRGDAPEVLWTAYEEEGEGQGLYHARIDSEGQATGTRLLLPGPVMDISFRTDREGTVHLAWQERPTYGRHYLYYATLDRDGRLSEPAEISSFPVVTGMIGRRPVVGLADGDVYLYWSLERRGGGLTPPSATSYYVAFPLGRPDLMSAPQPVVIPSALSPRYAPDRSSFNLRQTAQSDEAAFPSEFIYLPSSIRSHEQELATAWSVQLSGRRRENMQIVLTLWSQGELEGYQVVGKSRSSSLRPVLVEDDTRNLHLAWIDTAGFGRYDIYYASTAAEARARMNRVSAHDVLVAGANVLWAFVQALGFLPLAFIWFVVPLGVMSIFLFITAESGLDRRGPRIMLVVSIVIYLLFKYLTANYWLGAFQMPSLPRALLNLLSFVTPIAIVSLASIVTWFYIKRREFTSLLQAFAVFAGLDTMITLLVYVPGLLIE
jgi:hypothetical protein